MLRRIFAWILIIMFVLLTMNLFIFKIALTESVILYGMMIALFFFIKFFDRQGAHYGPVGPPDGQDGEFDGNDGSEVMNHEMEETSASEAEGNDSDNGN